ALGIPDDGWSWEAGVLEPGGDWTLLCYTDGRVEGRRQAGSVEGFGAEALVGAAAGLLTGGAGLDTVLDHLLDLVLKANGGDLSDDVAILCLARSRPPAGPAPEGTGRR